MIGQEQQHGGMGDGRNRKIKHPTTVVLLDAEADDIATATDDNDMDDEGDKKRDKLTPSMKNRVAATCSSHSPSPSI